RSRTAKAKRRRLQPARSRSRHRPRKRKSPTPKPKNKIAKEGPSASVPPRSRLACTRGRLRRDEPAEIEGSRNRAAPDLRYFSQTRKWRSAPGEARIRPGAFAHERADRMSASKLKLKPTAGRLEPMTSRHVCGCQQD